MSQPSPDPSYQGPETPGGSPNDRLLAALGYPIWIVALVVLLMEGPKDRAFPRYHAIQALGFTVVAVAFVVAVSIVSFCAGQITFFLQCLFWPLYLLPLAAALFFAYRTYTTDQYFEIPVLTDVMRQQGWLSGPRQ